MPAARQPLTLDRNGTFSETFIWTDDAGAPQPIGNQTATLTVYDGYTGQQLCQLTSTAGDILIEPGGTTGQLAVTATPLDTASLKRTGMYLLQLVSADGLTTTDLAYGPVRIGWRGMGL